MDGLKLVATAFAGGVALALLVLCLCIIFWPRRK